MKVSLFPFLPVLLCMMGAMILLLILIAWDVQEQAVNPAEAAAITQTMTNEEAEELRRKLVWQAEDADYYAEYYVLAKEQSETELAERQARLALAERETQKIKDELRRLEQLVPQFDSQASTTPEEVEYMKQLLAKQQQRVAEAELELAELRKEAAQKEKSYAIVPYRGPDGTFRRPIYIECRDDKVVIQPEGIELVPGDFQALDRPDNPFNTALRVIRQYYIDTEQIVRGSEPYPLLIVRPSGVEMFANAMQATGDWVEDFGYELVCEDWNILYPEPSEELCRRLAQQLDISRSTLSGRMIAQRMAQQTSGFGGGNTTQFRLDHRGNVTPVGGQSREEVQQRLAANRQGTGQPVGQEFSGNTSQQLTAPQGTVMEGTNEANRVSPSAERIAGGQPAQPGGEAVPEQQMPMMQPMQNPSQRAQNWALQGATQFTTGVSRKVQIRCEADRFVFPIQAGLATEWEIPIANSVSTATDQLVRAVWEFQNSWGSAGTDLHWRPILQVRVSPGGEQRLQELNALLRNSGLVIETL